MQKDFYITTAIAYPNAKPHIGFAMELVQADCLARYYAVKPGKDKVYFLTGTDDHGMKIFQTAKENNKTPKEWVDYYAQFFRELTKILNIENNDFIRTEEDRHQKAAQKFWLALKKKGDLYKAIYKGLYCVGCEAYILEKDLVDGKCPNHDKKPEFLEEENYFFKYTKYIDDVIKIIKKDEIKIIPEARKHEMQNLLEHAKKEDKDVSFSRPAKILPWGIPVPDDSSHTMYVWCDALTNYVTAIGYGDDPQKFNSLWPADIHVIGKDILRFHAGIWPAMLLCANLPLPKAIYVHGYITSEGKKMSKSLGNIVDPFELASEWGEDPVRYYLLREIPTTDDGDFSKERFKAIYNGELADNFGNLVSRILTMAKDLKENGKIADEKIQQKIDEAYENYHGNFLNFNLKGACENILNFAVFLNHYIEEKKPWALKENKEKVLGDLLICLGHLAKLLSPFMPKTSEKILLQLKERKVTALFPKK